MPHFVPSQLSSPAPTAAGGDDYGWAQLVGAAISAAGGITAGAIGAAAQKKTLAAQHEHERALAAEQAELIKLQTEATRSEADALRASMSLKGAKTKHVALGVGAILLGTALIAAGLVVRRREADEDEEDVE